MQIAGSNSLFIADAEDATLLPRHDAFLVGATGPLCGRDARLEPEGEPLAIEQSALADYGWWIEGLARCRLDADRRMLRANASGLDHVIKDRHLELTFSLDRGCYATSLLRELLDVTDATRVPQAGN